MGCPAILGRGRQQPRFEERGSRKRPSEIQVSGLIVPFGSSRFSSLAMLYRPKVIGSRFMVQGSEVVKRGYP